MKRFVFVFASVAAFAMSCTANPPILPEPNNATTGVGGFGGDGGAGDTSTSASSASGSSGVPLPGDGSGARLRRYVYKSGDGAAVGLTKFYDNVLQIDCQPLPTPNGTRCASYDQVIVGAYYDAACSLEAVSVAVGCVPGNYATKLETVAACPPTSMFRIFAIGAKQPTGFYKSGNTCTPSGPKSTTRNSPP